MDVDVVVRSSVVMVIRRMKRVKGPVEERISVVFSIVDEMRMRNHGELLTERDPLQVLANEGCDTHTSDDRWRRSDEPHGR
jgi:hypothetical protein